MLSEIFYWLSFAIMVVWFPLVMNLIFTLFVKRSKNGKFKLRFGKVKGHEQLNPFIGTGKSVLVLIIFELLAVALNLIFFNKIVELLALLRAHTIPIFLFTSSFFFFWVSRHDVGASWKNKWTYIPFIIFLSIIVIWGIILLILYLPKG